jgi:hypothetical protein
MTLRRKGTHKIHILAGSNLKPSRPPEKLSFAD